MVPVCKDASFCHIPPCSPVLCHSTTVQHHTYGLFGRRGPHPCKERMCFLGVLSLLHYAAFAPTARNLAQIVKPAPHPVRHRTCALKECTSLCRVDPTPRDPRGVGASSPVCLPHARTLTLSFLIAPHTRSLARSPPRILGVSSHSASSKLRSMRKGGRWLSRALNHAGWAGCPAFP